MSGISFLNPSSLEAFDPSQPQNPSFGGGIISLDLAAAGFVFGPARGHFRASIPPGQDRIGNGLSAIDVRTGELACSIAAAGVPASLAVSAAYPAAVPVNLDTQGIARVCTNKERRVCGLDAGACPAPPRR